jgi:hypothetical protein
MFPTSYSDVFKLEHEPPSAEEIGAGDLVRMGNNFHPHYEVIAVRGDAAWVREVQTGTDHLVRTDRCRKVTQPAQPVAA